MENKRIENFNMCAECGGACCKKSGCGYIVSDIKSFKFNDLKALLDEGNISIKATLYTNIINGVLKTDKVLILKSRSIDKGVVDLFSASTQCKLWTPTGCTYTLEERPSMGAGLIPNISRECCENLYDQETVLEEWSHHQDVLKKLVKVYTGKKMEYVYEEQFIQTVSEVLAKYLFENSDLSKLTLGEQEILEMISFAENDFIESDEIHDLIKLARKRVAGCLQALIEQNS